MPLMLRDNAVFVMNVRERLRPNTLIPVAIATALLAGLIVLFCSLADFDRSEAPRLWWAFFVISIGQGIVLLLSGSGSVAISASRERQSGTLDSHRTSPTSSFDIGVGMLLGPPALEWLIVLGLLPIAAGLALYNGTSAGVLIAFYASLFLCAIFFHTVTLFGVMAIESRRLDFYRASWPLGLALLTWFASGVGMGFGISVLANGTCISAYMDLLVDIGYSRPAEIDANILQLFNISMPCLLVQAIIQAPLVALLFVAVLRRISRPERPVFSKSQSLALVAYLYFLFIGTTIVFLPGKTLGGYRGYPDTTIGILVNFMYFAMFAGMISGAGTTPSRLIYLKGLRRAKKEDNGRLSWFDDHASNTPWLVSFCVATLAAYASFTPFVPTGQHLAQAVPLLVAIAYSVTFLAALEAFRLGRHHDKKNFFVLAVAVPWLFVPLLSFVFALVDVLEGITPYLSIACPFVGVGMTAGMMSDAMLTSPVSEYAFPISATVVNGLLATILLVLAQRQRHRLGELE
ncbi:MAG: hypothetical protein QGG73_10890 [Candidatus Hydrogenedentes bacterium]|nr:hypothetical protein [Candidatus Hydrogenedentota bacterium]